MTILPVEWDDRLWLPRQHLLDTRKLLCARCGTCSADWCDVVPGFWGETGSAFLCTGDQLRACLARATERLLLVDEVMQWACPVGCGFRAETRKPYPAVIMCSCSRPGATVGMVAVGWRRL